jgi:hypothetical protein
MLCTPPRGGLSEGPIVDRQAHNPAGITAIASQQGQVVYERHGGDAQILSPHAKRLGPEVLKLGLTRLIEG